MLTRRPSSTYLRVSRGVLAGVDSMSTKVFVSYISEEVTLASVLKRWIESTFPGEVFAFVSAHDIRPGQQWFNRLGEELTDAKAMLVLCSQRSISRRWINFEAGAGYVKGISVIPICFAGVTTDTLPEPLRFFQGLDAGEDDFGVKVIEALAQDFGYAKPPVIRHEDMTTSVKDALSQIEHVVGVVAGQGVPPHIFTGYASVDGQTAANGVKVEARIDGVPRGTATVMQGQYTFAVERGSSERVRFFVDGCPTPTDAKWLAGEASMIDLDAQRGRERTENTR